MDNVEVGRISEDGLTRQAWRFYYYNGRLLFSGYTLTNRPTKRHNFRLVASYSHLDNRHYATHLTLDEVPKPADVLAEAHRLFTEGVKAVWDREGR
jgi:hypothetical protein